MDINYIQNLKHTNKIEELKKKLCLGLIDNLGQPTDKESEYLLSMISGEHNSLPIPSNRVETLMYFALVGSNIDLLEKPNSSWSRKEKYWYAVATGYKNDVIEPGAGCSKEDILDYWLALYSAVREWLEVSGTKIVIPNSRQGYSKELAIRGRTLQNIITEVKTIIPSISNSVKVTKENNKITFTKIDDAVRNNANIIFNNKLIKDKTDYTIIVNITKNDFPSMSNYGFEIARNVNLGANVNIPINSIGLIKRKFTTNLTNITDSDKSEYWIGIQFSNASFTGVNGSIVIENVMLLEGDYTNIDLPNYIDGIESTGSKEGNKVSIESRGKNLLKKDLVYKEGFKFHTITGQLVANNDFCISEDYISIPNVNNCVYSNIKGINGLNIYEFDKNKNYISSQYADKIKSFNSATCYIRIEIYKSQLTLDNYINFSQLEEGTVATEYQPYQTPHLAEWQLTEPLRSLPNAVSDEVDKTGLETRRVGKTVLNSNNPNVRVEGFNSSFSQDINLVNYIISDGKNKNGTSQDYVIDKTIFVSTNDRNINNIDKICTFLDSANRGALIQYILPKSITNIEQAKTYIDSKNVTVLYELATPTTKQLEKKNIGTFEGGTVLECTNNVKGSITANVPVKNTY